MSQGTSAPGPVKARPPELVPPELVPPEDVDTVFASSELPELPLGLLAEPFDPEVALEGVVVEVVVVVEAVVEAAVKVTWMDWPVMGRLSDTSVAV